MTSSDALSSIVARPSMTLTPRPRPKPTASASVQYHEATGALLVEDPVTTLAAPDRVARADLVLFIAVATDVDGHARLGLLLLIHVCCCLPCGGREWLDVNEGKCSGEWYLSVIGSYKTSYILKAFIGNYDQMTLNMEVLKDFMADYIEQSWQTTFNALL